MELNDLRIFRSVAKHGSMSKAAAELGYVQSNVTSRIRALEEEFGVRLLDRSPRGVSLRPEGKRLLDYARRIDELFEQAKADLSSSGRRPLRIGASQTLTAAYLQPFLRDPDSGAEVFTRPLEQLSVMLDGGELDLILVNREPEGTGRRVKIFEAAEPIGWAAAAAVGRAENGNAALPPGLPVLAARDPLCPYRRQTLNWLAAEGSRRRLIEADTLDSLAGLVESGHGIALLPRKLHTARMREADMPGFREEPVFVGCFAAAGLPAFCRSDIEEVARTLKRLIESGANGPITTGGNRVNNGQRLALFLLASFRRSG
ncbi:LysR family transcriptional regulator [Saccharibacillus alkalitolerans]|uniref:LysR family transcriptional regulator n=1 Tax=Saccharibacillus alkalitolerans TaxID=2705290 RepID=A0ABX0F165_9BACL|nr:LysR family transcriptional regulator [Saccharibacillus alkalitolerans]NGZ74722.1 LysR family transcriptional regulator [Saccharibacillus alkalitolerans]